MEVMTVFVYALLIVETTATSTTDAAQSSNLQFEDNHENSTPNSTEKQKVKLMSYNQNNSQNESGHADHTEEWSLEDDSSSDTDDSLETTMILQLYQKVKDTTPMQKIQEKESIRRHRQNYKQKSEKDGDDSALNWLLDTIHEDVKASTEKTNTLNRKSHRKSRPTTSAPITQASVQEESYEHKRHSEHKRKQKVESSGNGTGIEHISKSKKHESQDKPDSERNFKVLRSGGYYTEKEHYSPRDHVDQARLQYENNVNDRKGHQEVLKSSEEQEVRTKKTTLAKDFNKLKKIPEKESIQRNRQSYKQKSEKYGEDSALKWLLDTIHEDVKASTEKTNTLNRKSHLKSRHTTSSPITQASVQEESNEHKRHSEHKRKQKVESSGNGTGIERISKSKKHESQNKPDSERNFKVLRSGGYYTEIEHYSPRDYSDQKRLQYENNDNDRKGHQEVLKSSEEQEVRTKKTTLAKDFNKLKYQPGAEIENVRRDPKHTHVEPDNESNENKHWHSEAKKKQSASKQYHEDKKKYSDKKYHHMEEERQNRPPKYQHNANKDKDRVLKHHYREKEKAEETHKHQHAESERDHGASKHHSNRIHNEKGYNNRSDNHGVHAVKQEDAGETIHKSSKLRHKANENTKKSRYPAGFQEEQSTTHHEVPPQKIIRMNEPSQEEPSSSHEYEKTTTKKVKLRKNKSNNKKQDDVNILRSTRMPPAYELQEENPNEEPPEEGGKDDQDKGNVEIIEEEKEPKDPKKKPKPKDDSRYTNEQLSPYTLEEQMEKFAELYMKKRSANISVQVIGRTVEYRNIVLLKMSEIDKDAYFRANDNSNKYADEKPEKKVVFIVHGLTVAGMWHIMHDVLTFNNLLRMYVSFVKWFDIYVIPMANPDGYGASVNSHAGTYWNKNLSPQSGCSGVHLDRNFDVAWNSSAEISSCSPLYPGPVPFSEAETRAVRDVFHLYSHRLMAYIHVHASTHAPSVFKGDAILYPKGYTDVQTDDDKYIDLKSEVEEAMKNASFQVLSVTVDSLYNWYGKVSGTSVDYASTIYGIPYAMEFAMQSYVDIGHHAMKQIWGRIIPVVFKSMWKHLNANPSDM